MSLYYQDDHVTLYQGDSLAILPTLEIEAASLMTDPPYFKVKQEEWDNQWDKAHEFLEWMGHFLDASKPLLSANASAWVFASPAMTSSVERLVGERFRVLNSIRWVKEQGWHQKAEIAALRSYLTPWEGIVFAEQQPTPNPIGDYLRAERTLLGIDSNDIEIALGFTRKKNPQRGTELVRRWEEGSSVPTSESYTRLQSEYPGKFRRDYDDLRREYEDLRRPFNIETRAHSTDVWNFPTVPPGPGKHPCEKPLSMLRHMIETTTRPGDLILDPFAGSGSTLDAARQAGRRAIGIEKDKKWCDYIARRLSQEVLDLGALA